MKKIIVKAVIYLAVIILCLIITVVCYIAPSELIKKSGEWFMAIQVKTAGNLSLSFWLLTFAYILFFTTATTKKKGIGFVLMVVSTIGIHYLLLFTELLSFVTSLLAVLFTSYVYCSYIRKQPLHKSLMGNFPFRQQMTTITRRTGLVIACASIGIFLLDLFFYYLSLSRPIFHYDFFDTEAVHGVIANLSLLTLTLSFFAIFGFLDKLYHLSKKLLLWIQRGNEP